jgi:TorA maturation chaperone TorD
MKERINSMNTVALNKVRAIYYGLFSSLFSYINSEKDFNNIKQSIELLSQAPIDENSKTSFDEITSFLNEKGMDGLIDENNQIFYSPSTTFIPVTASFYNEDRDDGQKRVEMTNIVLKSIYRRDNTNFKEAEDHVCFIFNFIQKLLEQDYSKIDNKLVVETFSVVLNSFIDSFIQDVYNHEDSHFYKNIAVILKVFVELERTLLNIKKPIEHKVRKQYEIFHKKRKSFTKRAKRNFDEISSL